MKRRHLFRVFLLLSSALVLIQPLEAMAQWKGEIKIGQVCSLFSPVQSICESQRDGATIACEEINKAGGVLGRKLTYIYRDDGNQIDNTVAQAKELCIRENIDFAFTNPRSSYARATSAVYQRYKVPTLLLCPMADTVLEMGNPYYMRLCHSDTVCGDSMSYTVEKGNFKRPSIMYLNDFWGMDLRKILLKKIKERGLEVVSEASFDSGASDVSPQVMKILTANPDVILLLAYSGEAATIVRTFKSQGFKGSYIGYSGLFFNPVREAGGHDFDGAIFQAGRHCQGFYIWNRPGAIPLYLKLEALVPKGKYTLVNASPEIDTLDGYQAVYLIKKWLELAGERGLTDKDYFMDVVTKSKVETIVGTISFPYGAKKLDTVTLDDTYLMQFVNGHARVWEHDPRCIETFEKTRNQAEEEVYSKGFVKGVTFKKYLARWQELLKQNEAKIKAEINTKLEKKTITRDYADMFRKALEEILAYNFK